MMQIDHTIPFDFPDLRDRVAIVTGAARGIGLAIVRQMAQAGVKVAAWDLPGTDWRDVHGVPAESRLTFEGDVGQAQDWQRILDEVHQRWGRLDILVNNAGISGPIGALVECEDAEFDEVMRVNARGVFLGLKYGARVMGEHGGAIINMASVSGIGGGRYTVAYTASKHAVVGMTRLAAAELAPRRIRVNAVCPAPTSTEMMFAMERSQSPHDPEAVRRGMTRMNPMGRYAEPQEVASLVMYLSSQASSFITGTAIPVDGGLKAA